MQQARPDPTADQSERRGPTGGLPFARFALVLQLVVNLLFCLLVDPFGSSTTAQLYRIMAAHDPTAILNSISPIAVSGLFLLLGSAMTGFLTALASRKHPARAIAAVGLAIVLIVIGELVTTPGTLPSVAAGCAVIATGYLASAWLTTIILDRRRSAVTPAPPGRAARIVWRGWLGVTTAGVAVIVTIIGVGIPAYALAPSDAVTRVDAVIVLGPPTRARLAAAVDLVESGAASTVVVSTTVDRAGGFATSLCKGERSYDVICFKARPFTTRGELIKIDAMARARGWSSVALISSEPHLSRIRYIADRCLDVRGLVLAADRPTTLSGWSLSFLYQSAAFVKLFVLPPCA